DRDPRDLALTDVDYLRPTVPQRAQLKPTSLAAPAHVKQHEDPFSVQLAVLVDVGYEPVPGRQRLPHGFYPSGMSLQRARLGAVDGHVVDLGARPGGLAVVAALTGRVELADELYVRRGHRASIPSRVTVDRARPGLGVARRSTCAISGSASAAVSRSAGMRD